jgi:hypothetical protein
MAVVVVLVLAEHGGAVPRVDDQGAVEEFAADAAADEAFGDRVGPRRPYRWLDDADVGSGEDGVERGGELGVAVSDEVPEATAGGVEVHEQVAGLLGQPGTGGMRGDAEDVHSPGGVLNDEERIQPAQGDGVDVEEVASQDGVRLGAQELRPGRSGTPHAVFTDSPFPTLQAEADHRHHATACSRLCAIPAQLSQAALAVNTPEGRWARGPSIRSALSCSVCPAVTSGASRRTRRTINSAVTACLPRDANAV